MKVLVTGGSGEIGRAIVRRFAQDGASVALTYRSDAQAAEEAAEEARQAAEHSDVRVETYELDVCDSKAVDRIVERVIAGFDGLDVVVNNAGVMDNQAVAMMSDDTWRTVIDTNLSGPFYVCRAALTHLMLQRSGRIVNVSSIAEDGASGQANYAASKAGLIGLTRSLAKEYGPRGVTANCVVPGLVDTKMIADADERIVDHWERFCPAGRLARVDEVADAVWYLSRPQAAFVNGAVLRVSGGLDTAP